MIIHNWRDVLRRAWSVRLIAIAAILSGVEVAMQFFDASVFGLPDGVFAIGAGCVSMAALAARMIAQKDISNGHE